MPPYASIQRIIDGQFSEADVNLIILYERENNPTQIIRELGDFVAHPSRDRGIINSAALAHYCRSCFLVKYQAKEPDILSLSGNCDWFLKHFLMSQINRSEPYEVKKKLKRRPEFILREINSYFPPKEEFPTTFGSNPKNYTVIASERFESIVEFCAKKIMIEPVKNFNEQTFLFEIEKVLKKYEIQISRRDDFIICICILLHKKTYFYKDGKIGETRLILGDNIDVFLDAHPPKHKDYDISINIPLLQTSIKAARYFNESLCEKVRLSNINTDNFMLGFKSDSNPKVSIIKKLEASI